MIHPIVEALLAKLTPIQEKYGPLAYARAVEQAAREILRTETPEVQQIVRETFKHIVDFDRIDREMANKPPQPSPPSMDFNQLIAAQIKVQVPGLQTQAQFDVFMSGFNAYRMYMNHVFLGEMDKAVEVKKVLLQSLDMAVKATELSEKLGHVPEAANSKESDAFKQPPKEFGELEIQRSLLEELSEVQTLVQLKQWYESRSNRGDFLKVVSQNLRNELFDTIRARKSELQ